MLCVRLRQGWNISRQGVSVTTWLRFKMQKAPLAKRGSLGRRPGVGRAYPLYFQRRSLPTVPTGESEISFLT
jgi:hypothetical protein